MAISARVGSGGFDFVNNGGTASGTAVNGGVEYVEAGGTAIGTGVLSGADVIYGTISGLTLRPGPRPISKAAASPAA